MKKTLLLTVLALLLISSSAFAAVDAFIWFEGVKGEAKGKTFSLPIDQNGNVKGTNLPAGDYKVSMCATGQHIKEAKLFVRKQGTDQHDYYTIDISSFSWGITQTSTRSGGVSVAAGDVDGDGRADATSTGKAKGIVTNSGTGGGGKASYSDLSFSMKTSDGKTASYGGGGGAGKVQMQDFHFNMKPAPKLGNDMYSGDMGMMTIGGLQGGKWAIDSFFDIFIEID